MSKTYDLLKQAGVFFLATINGDKPALRPFGAVMELGGELYFSTAKGKDVYAQLVQCPAIQIAAMTGNEREWLRISGNAVEVSDLSAKQAMLDACPILLKHFPTSGDEKFALFKITDMEGRIL